MTPNALVSLSANSDLVSNTLTPAHPTSIVVKLLGSTGACNPAAPGALASGLLAWGTTLHSSSSVAGGNFGTEIAFSPATLSAGELARITSFKPTAAGLESVGRAVWMDSDRYHSRPHCLFHPGVWWLDASVPVRDRGRLIVSEGEGTGVAGENSSLHSKPPNSGATHVLSLAARETARPTAQRGLPAGFHGTINCIKLT